MRTTGWLLLATIAFCIGVWLTATGWGRPRHGVAARWSACDDRRRYSR
jgi:hypothetical protein